MVRRSKWSLIGVPDHEAVLNVGGRIGAARGPQAFRQIFSRMKGRAPLAQSCVDEGNVKIGASIEENHEAAAQAITKAQLETGLSVVVGGSHDHGYSHLLGVARSLGFPDQKIKLGCINI